MKIEGESDGLARFEEPADLLHLSRSLSHFEGERSLTFFHWLDESRGRFEDVFRQEEQGDGRSEGDKSFANSDSLHFQSVTVTCVHSCHELRGLLISNWTTPKLSPEHDLEMSVRAVPKNAMSCQSKQGK